MIWIWWRVYGGEEQDVMVQLNLISNPHHDVIPASYWSEKCGSDRTHFPSKQHLSVQPHQHECHCVPLFQSSQEPIQAIWTQQYSDLLTCDEIGEQHVAACATAAVRTVGSREKDGWRWEAIIEGNRLWCRRHIM